MGDQDPGGKDDSHDGRRGGRHGFTVLCPNCGDLLEIAHGGWPYRYSQAMLHLDRCMAGATKSEREAVAQKITESDT